MTDRSDLINWLRTQAKSDVLDGLFDSAAKGNEAADELQRLWAIVDRLKTSDGVPFGIGDSVFVPETQALVQVGVLYLTRGGVRWSEDVCTQIRDGWECYSTRDAFEKARTV